MPIWLKDTAVLTTIITACSGLLTVLLNKMFEWKSNKAKSVLEDISTTLCALKQQVDGINQTTVAINHQNDVIQDGTRKIQRYRLYHDLKREVTRGYTTLDHFRELSILFESYKNLGGNGEVEALFEKYKELPIREEDTVNEAI
nr:MAG TPA: holin protein [Caudoviricetes sp.]